MSRRSTFLTVVLLASIVAALPACRREGTAPAVAVKTALYICPMHPDVRSDKPGSCPICGMDLVKAEPAGPAAAQAAPPPSGVAGRAGVTLSAERPQVLGVRSQEIHHARLERAIRTVGRIAVDESRLHHVHTKFEGYVEHLHVDFTGAFVRKGDPLLSIYSPELVATQQEYLLAYRAQQRLGGSPVAAAARGSADLLEAARQRLLLWDILEVAPENVDCTECVLHLTRRRTLVQESMSEGALRVLSLPRRLAALQFFRGLETKWFALGELLLEGEAADSGHAVFEEVVWS